MILRSILSELYDLYIFRPRFCTTDCLLLAHIYESPEEEIRGRSKNETEIWLASLVNHST